MVKCNFGQEQRKGFPISGPVGGKKIPQTTRASSCVFKLEDAGKISISTQVWLLVRFAVSHLSPVQKELAVIKQR